MNKQRRKAIADLIQRLDALAIDVADAQEDADDLASEEREYFDNMPENMQQGEKGEAASAGADALEEARDTLESARDSISEAMDKLREAMEGG